MNANSDSSVCGRVRQVPCISKASTTVHVLAVALAGLMLSGLATAQRTAPVAQPLPSPIVGSEDLANANTCPAPMTQKLVVKPTDPIEAADMPNEWQAGNGLNGTKTNTFYGHTFRWNTRGRCCQVTRAVLTVNFKALQNGSFNGPNAFNDTISVTDGGMIVAVGISGDGRIWPQAGLASNFPAGNTTSKTITITNPSILASGRLSFYVQDDTAITGATLTITGCCLNVAKLDAAQ